MGLLYRGFAVVVLAGLSCELAAAQGPGGYQGQAQAQGGLQMFANPAMNPFMNPYAAGAMPNNPDFLLYMYSANQANGGFGTGVMSGTRPAQGQRMGANGQMIGQMNNGPNPNPSPMIRNAPITKGGRPRTQSQTGRQPALMPMATSVPGAGASGFFNQGFDSSGGAGRFYNRTGQRFQNNGR